jgi:hypothetical protein
MEIQMQAISRDQSHEVIGRFIRLTKWGALDHDALQQNVIGLSEEDFSAKPFDPAKFIGSGWGIVEEDQSALALTEIDFSKVRFEHGLKDGESVIDGEEKLKRLKTLGLIRLDAKAGQTLYEEKGQPTLRFLHDVYGITWFELAGTVLRYSSGDRYFLYLYRGDDGSWYWDCSWLDDARNARNVSPLLAS